MRHKSAESSAPTLVGRSDTQLWAKRVLDENDRLRRHNIELQASGLVLQNENRILEESIRRLRNQLCQDQSEETLHRPTLSSAEGEIQ